MTCLGRGAACLGELESAGGTAELFFAAVVVGRTKRLADEEVCAAVFFLPFGLAAASGLARWTRLERRTVGEREMDED